MRSEVETVPRVHVSATSGVHIGGGSDPAAVPMHDECGSSALWAATMARSPSGRGQSDHIGARLCNCPSLDETPERSGTSRTTQSLLSCRSPQLSRTSIRCSRKPNRGWWRYGKISEGLFFVKSLLKLAISWAVQKIGGRSGPDLRSATVAPLRRDLWRAHRSAEEARSDGWLQLHLHREGAQRAHSKLRARGSDL